MPIIVDGPACRHCGAELQTQGQVLLGFCRPAHLRVHNCAVLELFEAPRQPATREEAA